MSPGAVMSEGKKTRDFLMVGEPYCYFDDFVGSSRWRGCCGFRRGVNHGILEPAFVADAFAASFSATELGCQPMDVFEWLRIPRSLK